MKLYITFTVLLWIIYFNPTRSNAEVVDLSDKWHFKSIESQYLVGNNVMICVELDDGRFAIWNPLEISTHLLFQPKCITPREATEIPPMFTEHAADNQSGVKLPSAINQNKIYLITNITQNCNLNYVTYYEKLSTKNTLDKFYLIGKLKKPLIFGLDKYCNPLKLQSTHIKKVFDIIPIITSVYLGNSVWLVYSFDKSFSQRVLILLGDIQDSTWHSGAENFIIPVSKVKSALEAAGSDIVARNSVLETEMAKIR